MIGMGDWCAFRRGSIRVWSAGWQEDDLCPCCVRLRAVACGGAATVAVVTSERAAQVQTGSAWFLQTPVCRYSGKESAP